MAHDQRLVRGDEERSAGAADNRTGSRLPKVQAAASEGLEQATRGESRPADEAFADLSANQEAHELVQVVDLRHAE